MRPFWPIKYFLKPILGPFDPVERALRPIWLNQGVWAVSSNEGDSQAYFWTFLSNSKGLNTYFGATSGIRRPILSLWANSRDLEPYFGAL